jgi:hypothetical protein
MKFADSNPISHGFNVVEVVVLVVVDVLVVDVVEVVVTGTVVLVVVVIELQSITVY